MKELKTEKKTEGQTYNRTKSVQDSVGYRHKTEPDFVGSGYHPPERFVPLLAKFSHPANATQRAQLFVQLQRQYGNRYVQKVVSAYRSGNVEEGESTLASEIISKKGSGRPLELGNQAVQRLFNSGVIQAKLRIGQPNDKYEQEADRVAEQVMRMPEPQVQRQEEEEKEEKKFVQTKPLSEQITPSVQRQVEEEEEEILQTRKNPDQTLEVTPDLESRIHAIRGSGQPLPESVRTFFEPRFGYDFSRVRVHTDGKAAQSARTLNAMAFTAGRDIVFGAGRHVPNTTEGKRLLAHELAHVVQQSFENPKGYRLPDPAIVSLPRGLTIQIQRFCTLPSPTSVPSGTSLNSTELQRRRTAIQQAISRSRSTYPLSAANLQYWLDGSGNNRLIPQGEYNFTNPDSGVPRHLLRLHRQEIAEGIERRLNPAHHQSLQPPGTIRLLSWQDSMRALPIRLGTLQPSPAMERDLSTALGGFTVSSRVRLRALQPRGNRQEVEVLSWQVHICDRYDWIVGAAAPILIPSSVALPPIPQGAGTVRRAFGMQLVTVNDVWMAEVEQSGGARAYDIYSDIFNAPTNVRQKFVAVNGNVSP